MKLFLRINRGALACWVLLTWMFPAMGSHTGFPRYYVHLTRGECYLTKPGERATLLKQKDLLYSGDIIGIKKDNVEIHLVDKDGNFLVLNKKGNYKVAELDNIPLKKTTGIVQKYLHFLWEDLFHPEPGSKILNEENLAGSWGGASRSDEECKLALSPLEEECISSDTLKFTWRQFNADDKYNLVLQSENGNEVMNLVLADTTLLSISPGMRGSVRSAYFLSVKSANQQCRVVPKTRFYLLTKEEEAKSIASIIAKVSDADPVLYNLQVADALAASGFFTEAKKYLSKAIAN